jgi:acetyl-CoA carboxylase biotin carboxylase subunit
VFRKVLIANRGEIAVRLARALRESGIGSVAVFSDVDRNSLAVSLADEAAYLGPAPAAESYLNIDKILETARRCGAEAIHPGYGFLSENAEFAQACHAAGLVFIGPPAEAIRKMGSKTEARRLALEAGAPVVPGSDPVQGAEEAKAVAERLGYPVLLKAAAGGGGKGMRRVDRESELESAFREASSEAERAFGNGEMYLEKLLAEPRHIEIQVLGDHHGRLIHLGERECSIQRRHQKVIEECPSPFVAQHPGLRERMGEAAVRVARAAGYANAGTIEFLVDRDANFYFLEMNTRLQVEHPVTELVTGLDLVHWQLRIAAGEPLAVAQEQVSWRGAAIECRVYAEDPDQGFLPSPGRIEVLREPAGPGVRLDSGVYEGWTVPLEYDPLLAKLAVWAADRGQAIARMRRALSEYTLLGVRNNLGLFQEILASREFYDGRFSTSFLDGFLERRPPPARDPEVELAAALAMAVARHRAPQARPVLTSRWLAEGRQELLR